jgi:Cu(I)/Ag(I) efflux system periplasmic protein CusF
MTRLSSLFGALIVSTGLALLVADASAQAQGQMHDHDQHGAMATTSQDDPDTLSEGVVQKADKDTGKLTIKHGPLNNLGMPAMTMAFKVQDPAMLDQVKAGEQIRFRAERANGSLVITKLQVSK